MKKEEVVEDARDDRLDALEAANLEELDELEVLHHHGFNSYVCIRFIYY